jgi:hypothetical protein
VKRGRKTSGFTAFLYVTPRLAKLQGKPPVAEAFVFFGGISRLIRLHQESLFQNPGGGKL